MSWTDMQAVTKSKDAGAKLRWIWAGVQLHVLDAQRLLLLVATGVGQHGRRQVDSDYPGTSPG